jgi:hypothetical protein
MFLASVMRKAIDLDTSDDFYGPDCIGCDQPTDDGQDIADRAETNGVAEVSSTPPGAVASLQIVWMAASDSGVFVDAPMTLELHKGWGTQAAARQITYTLTGLLSCGMSLVPGETTVRNGFIICAVGQETLRLTMASGGDIPAGHYLPTIQMKCVLPRVR